jgi:hypothetical protein
MMKCIDGRADSCRQRRGGRGGQRTIDRTTLLGIAMVALLLSAFFLKRPWQRLLAFAVAILLTVLS